MTVTLEIMVNGKVLTTYTENGTGNTFIEGREGSEYELRIKNNSSFRVLVIPSVDGLSVMDGEEAGLDSSGYVLGPWQTTSIPGWRLNKEAVAKFKFGSVGGSYSVQSGKGTTNVGVIGLAVYKEKVRVYPVFHSDPFYGQWHGYGTGAIPKNGILRSMATNITSEAGNTGSTDVSASINAMATTQSLGTEFGDKADFKTTSTNFERGDLLNVISLFYDTANGLASRGIIVNPARMTTPQPSAFPKYDCQPPAGWKG